jgi:hypothetical protein
MIIEIPKGASEKKAGKKNTKKALLSFFGKLPHIEDGLKHQKNIRNEWK